MTNFRQLLITAAQVSASMGIGDLVCQSLEQDFWNNGFDSISIDVERTGRMCVTGALVSGPWSHFQYQIFERLVPGTSGLQVAKKVFGAAALAPVSISLMFSSVLLLQNKADQIQTKLEMDVLETWGVGALYWPFVLSLNFRYVPLHHRPLVGAFAGSFWNVYTAFKANKTNEQEGASEDLEL